MMCCIWIQLRCWFIKSVVFDVTKMCFGDGGAGFSIMPVTR